MPIPEYVSPLGGTYITWVDGSGALRVLAFDATLRTIHSGEATVTAHPIDSGATISDHVRANPRRVSIEAEVTNTPILAPEGVTGSVSALDLSAGYRRLQSGALVSGGGGTQISGIPLIGPFTIGRTPVEVTPAEYAVGNEPAAAQVLQFPTTFDRIREVWDTLEALRINGVEVSIVCRTTQYLRAVILTVSGPEEPADSMVLAIEAQEILTASSETVSVDPPVRDLRARAPKAAGAAAGYSLDEAPARGSVLRAAVTSLGLGS